MPTVEVNYKLWELMISSLVCEQCGLKVKV
jgi:hypothetical protein